MQESIKNILCDHKVVYIEDLAEFIYTHFINPQPYSEDYIWESCFPIGARSMNGLSRLLKNENNRICSKVDYIILWAYKNKFIDIKWHSNGHYKLNGQCGGYNDLVVTDKGRAFVEWFCKYNYARMDAQMVEKVEEGLIYDEVFTQYDLAYNAKGKEYFP